MNVERPLPGAGASAPHRPTSRLLDGLPVAAVALLLALTLIDRWWAVRVLFGAVALVLSVLLARRPLAGAPSPAPAAAVEPGHRRTDGQLASSLLPVAQDARTGIEKIRLVVADAVAGLGDAFTGMHADANAQRELIEEMLAALQRGDRAGGQVTLDAFVRESAELLARFVALAGEARHQSLAMAERIDDLSTQLTGTVAMLEDIRAIADRTRLVALNATIEASRAGEFGAGFAVVAAEVRQLSVSSNAFNEQIRGQIEQTRHAMEQARDLVHATADRDSAVLEQGRAELDRMSEQMHALDAMLHERAGRAAQAADRISATTSTAVRSLQFEDIVRQIAEHSEARLTQVVGLLEVAAGGKADGASPADRADPLDAAALELLRSVPARPAEQQDVSTGEIELF